MIETFFIFTLQGQSLYLADILIVCFDHVPYSQPRFGLSIAGREMHCV
jgi:hypothetical protein